MQNVRRLVGEPGEPVYASMVRAGAKRVVVVPSRVVADAVEFAVESVVVSVAAVEFVVDVELGVVGVLPIAERERYVQL